MDGSRRRNLRTILSGSFGEELSFEKNSRPSFDGCVRAERREEIWWRTGVVDPVVAGLMLTDVSEFDVWIT